MSENDEADAVEEPDTDEADTGDGSEEEQTGLQEEDFVRLAYTLRTAEDGRVVDTTDEEIAEEAGIADDDYDFSPRVIVIGAGHVFESVDEALIGSESGDEGTVEIPAAEAFGEHDPDNVRTVSVEKIPEDDRYPGAQVTLDGQQGMVETVIGGRARVDFNHPLAGQDLEYEYEILDALEDREEKARGLLGVHLQEPPEVRIETDEVEEEQVVTDPEDLAEDEDEEAEGDETEGEGDAAAAEAEADEPAEPETETVTVEKETLYIEATPTMAMNQQWMFQKQQIAQELMDRLDLDRVIVEEVIEGGAGMMGGMGGMMGGMGATGGGDIEEALEDVDVDADELVEELEGEVEE